MSFDARVVPLLRVPLFQGLTQTQLTAIAKSAERVMFKAGETIITNDVNDNAAYLIVKGRVEATSGFSRRAEILPPGTLVGEMAMLIEALHTTTVVAIDPVNALRLSRAALQSTMLEDPDIAAHFVEKLKVRLRHLARELKDVDAHLYAESVPPALSAQLQYQ